VSDFTSIDLAVPQRQSLWAVAFLAFRTLRSVGIVQLVLFVGFVVARLPSLPAVLALAAAIGIALFAAAVLRWWRYTFQVDSDELIVNRGVFQQQRLSIPLSRVQSVSLEQKLLHRIVSLVQVSLDTAGAEEAEFVIDAVDRNVARTLQQAVATHRPVTGEPAEPGELGEPVPGGEQMPPAPEQILIRHSPRRVVQIALSQSPFTGLVLVAPLFAIGDDLGQFLPFELPTIDEPTGFAWLWWFVPLALVVGFLTSVALNLVRVVLTDWNLTLRSTPAGLRRDAGLVSTTSVASPLPRVQIFETSQGPIEKWWSLRHVNLATVGEANLAIPGCTRAQAELVRQLVLTGSAGVDELDQHVSRAEIFQGTRNASVVAAMVTAALAFAIGWWSMLVLVLVPVVAMSSWQLVRRRRWAVTNEAVALEKGLIGWRRQEALLRKLNSVTVSQRLFERSRGLATVTIATAAGVVSIGMIALEDAQHLRDLALYTVETDRQPWM